MARITADENSERKRISIPKADDSVLAWWDVQKDPGLSVRLLIRNEIERNGYTDAAYRPVAQLPRRGRPPGVGIDGADDADGAEGIDSIEDAGRIEYEAAVPAPILAPVAVTQRVAEPVTPARAPEPTPVAAAAPAPVPVPVHAPAGQLVAAGGHSFIDDLMNG